MLFKRSKKEIPDELPDLTLNDSGEIKESSVVRIQKEFPTKEISKPKIIYDEEKEPEILNSDTEQEESGFFKEVMDNLVKDTKNIDKIESFYNNRFMTEDIVSQMRTYWENKKPELLMKSVGKDLKEKIAGKTEKLHKLEHEWQDIYFALLTKEEEIRSEEKELKEDINEFMSVCKKAYKKKKN
jgi:hypothetical protein